MPKDSKPKTVIAPLTADRNGNFQNDKNLIPREFILSRDYLCMRKFEHIFVIWEGTNQRLLSETVSYSRNTLTLFIWMHAGYCRKLTV